MPRFSNPLDHLAMHEQIRLTGGACPQCGSRMRSCRCGSCASCLARSVGCGCGGRCRRCRSANRFRVSVFDGTASRRAWRSPIRARRREEIAPA
jgi:hypothetical protein